MSEPQVILITGASRGIGRGLAAAASRDGHHVVINHRAAADQAQALAKELGHGPAQAVALQADVCIAKDVDRLTLRSGILAGLTVWSTTRALAGGSRSTPWTKLHSPERSTPT